MPHVLGVLCSHAVAVKTSRAVCQVEDCLDLVRVNWLVINVVMLEEEAADRRGFESDKTGSRDGPQVFVDVVCVEIGCQAALKKEIKNKKRYIKNKIKIYIYI